MCDIKDLKRILDSLELEDTNNGVCDGKNWFGSGKETTSISPINGEPIARVKQGSADDYENVVHAAEQAFYHWREIPAPKRGEVVRQLGLELRRKKEPLGKLVTIEMGKSVQEGLGEVQEMIDICDMAVGQSRMLYGVQTHSERKKHRMFEQYHPLGPIGIITSFNFPVAVWAWNTAIALIAGDTCVWKPASSVPLTAIACQKIIQKVLLKNNIPQGISTLITGRGSDIGDFMIGDIRLPLISYTGSTKIGKRIGEVVGKRLGRSILELGGNNAIIITKNGNIKLAAQNVLFGAIGTAGQRCTTTRRVIIEDVIYDDFKKLLSRYYDKVSIGNPLDESNLMGPVVNTNTVSLLMDAVERVKKEGGFILREPKKLNGQEYKGGCYVTPAIAEVPGNLPIVKEETFAPLLYLLKYSEKLENGITLQNDVPQGLSSAIFTDNLQEAELFLSVAGSDCGIANVNLGTSGAEIGLAFGGEKETGGGRESGSDAWKGYMRRQTNTINWGGETILAQGIQF